MFESIPLMIICLIGWLIFATIYYVVTGCEKRKDENVHIVKGNGWTRYYTNEGWSEE